MITHIHYPRSHSLFFAPHTQRMRWIIRGTLLSCAVFVFGIGGLTIASVVTAYRVEREVSRTDAITESHRALEDAYGAKVEELRAAGDAFGLVASEKPQYIESFSSVAKADL
ncbi:MAG: hypothetical protein HYS44_01300 [Candidatus Niyogibacteria bacterium]|nr:hypothetical protein [Candidatus Niyogibacteria bacterium]